MAISNVDRSPMPLQPKQFHSLSRSSQMTHANTIRYLAHQARLCRDRDSSEAFCLLLPALLRVLDLDPMEDVEAGAFRHEFKQALASLPFQDETDRALARPGFLAQSMQGESTHAEASEKLPGSGEPSDVADRPAFGCAA